MLTTEQHNRIRSNDKKVNADQLTVSVDDLLSDTIAATRHFASVLKTNPKSFKKGTLVAFNKARQELQ